MIRHLCAAIAVTFIPISIAACGQLPERPQSSKPATEPAPSGAVSPELETFSRMIALQARPDQVGYFNSATSARDRYERETQPVVQGAN